MRPLKTTAYVLTSVRNSCGTGTLAARVVVVTVNPLLGTDDPSLADAVEVYPMPATTRVTVRIREVSPKQPALLELTDLTGRTTTHQETHLESSTLSLDQRPTGTYLLHIQVGDRRATRRIVKL